MKIQVTQDVSIFGKKRSSYSARLDGPAFSGTIEGTGANRTEATESLLRRFALMDEHQLSRTYRRAADGTVFVLYYADGWCYDMLRPEYGRPSSCMCGRIPQSHALAMMESHVAQISADVVAA